MHITIVGTGNVGRALAAAWRRVGHQVALATRDPESANAAELKREGFAVVGFSEAANTAPVIVLAVPWDGMPGTIHALGNLEGKILVDATNPLTASLELALGFNDSAGEMVALLAKGASVVKAFNTTGAANMANSHYPGGKLMMPIAGDDTQAKRTVAGLAAEIGFDPVDTGPLTMSRYLEPMAMAWIKLAYAQGMGTQFGFALLKR